MTQFSIIIPAYNNLPLLRRALDSVLRQQGVEMEVIVSDDSTNSGIADYVSTLGDPRLHYHHHDKADSAIANWNSGLAKASGSHLILMHHDEAMATPDYLATLQRLFDNGADIVVSNIEVVVGDKTKPSHFTTAMKRFILRHPSLLFLANAIGPCACIAFRRQLAEPFCEQLHWLVDVEWYYRLLKNHHVSYAPQLTIRSIHGHEGQITQSLDIRSTFEADRRIVLHRHPGHPVRLTLWLYKALILNTKQLLKTLVP